MTEEDLYARLREVSRILSHEICARKDHAVFTPDFIFSSRLCRVEEPDLRADDQWFAYSTGATFAFARGVTLAEFVDLYQDGRIEFRPDEKLNGIVEKGYIITKRDREKESPPAPAM